MSVCPGRYSWSRLEPPGAEVRAAPRTVGTDVGAEELDPEPRQLKDLGGLQEKHSENAEPCREGSQEGKDTQSERGDEFGGPFAANSPACD
jgi:hypothetical protein